MNTKLAASAAATAALTTAMLATGSAGAITSANPTYSQTSQCQIVGAGHSAPIYYAGYGRLYPVAFVVKTPYRVPDKRIKISFSGAGIQTYTAALDVSTYDWTTTTGMRTWRIDQSIPKNGTLTMKMSYPGDATHVPCGATVTVTVR